MEIVNGFNRKCKDAISGVTQIWLLKYKKYSRSQIVTNGNYLVSFPETFIYEFNSVQNPAPSETMEQNEGGKFYNQSISLTFPNSSTKDTKELASLDEVDPEILKTFEKLGISLEEQKRLSGVQSNIAVDVVFDSVSVKTTFKETLAEKGIIFCSVFIQ